MTQHEHTVRGSSPHKYPKPIQPLDTKGYFLITRIPMWYLKAVVERSRATFSSSPSKISILLGFVKLGTERFTYTEEGSVEERGVAVPSLFCSTFTH